MSTSPKSQKCQSSSQFGSLKETSSTPSLISSSAGTPGFGDRCRSSNKRKPFPSKSGRKPKKGKKEEETRTQMGSANSSDGGEMLTRAGDGHVGKVTTSHSNTPELRCSQDSSTIISLHTFPRKSGRFLPFESGIRFLLACILGCEHLFINFKTTLPSLNWGQ